MTNTSVFPLYVSIFSTGLFEFLAAVTEKSIYLNGGCVAFMLMSILYFLVSLVEYNNSL